LNEIKNKIKKLQKIISELEVMILDMAGFNVIKEPFFSVVGTWNCDKSPCGLCCYHHYVDPVHDECVFCGNPEERK